MKNLFARLALAVAVPGGLFLSTQPLLAQGNLTPPGAPAATMKTLSQVEPRTIVNAANTPGDAGDSFIISQPGSYYLTTNLTGVSGQAGVITITTNNVTLDLNGFALLGVPDTENAIYIPNAQTNITVRNGTISGWGSGVLAFSTSAWNLVFEHLNISASANGIYVYGACVVRDCNCMNIIGSGIVCTTAGTVTGCTVESCGNYGINCSVGSVTGCTVENCSSYGIYTGNDCVVKDCEVSGNGGTGIYTGNFVLITGCTVVANTSNNITTGNVCKVADCVVASSAGYGIAAGDDALVIGCHVNGNTSGGIKIGNYSLVRDNMVDYDEGTTTTPGITATGSRNRIEANNITRSGIGLQVTGTGNLIVCNSVSGITGVAYSIVASNAVGVIVVPTSSAAISGSTGGGTGTMDPTANFAY
jgi:hypothetical protein